MIHQRQTEPDGYHAHRRHHEKQQQPQQQPPKRPTSTHSEFSQEEVSHELKRINSFMDQAYTLVWHEEEYEAAVRVLKEALVLQEAIRGKYHRETGYTYSFIGTTLWFAQECHLALLYLCEARRIFHRISCTKLATAIAEGKTPPSPLKAVGQIKDRITKILEELGMTPYGIADYHETLNHAVEHEQQRWHYQEMGDHQMARLEMNKARTCSETLKRATLHRQSRYAAC